MTRARLMATLWGTMLRRLLMGLVVGLVVGGIVAAGLVAGLHVATFVGTGGTVLAYVAAALTGVLTGLVTGKPIWSSGAKVEAGLKAFFGALIGAGGMFALHRWAGSCPIDLPVIGVTAGSPISELPAASLPLLAAALGGIFALDNTGGDQDAKAAGAPERRRVAADLGARSKAGRDKANPASAGETDSDDEAEVVSKRAKS